MICNINMISNISMNSYMNVNMYINNTCYWYQSNVERTERYGVATTATHQGGMETTRQQQQ